MTKQRAGEPWRPADEYGRELPTFSVNLIVRDVTKSAKFYTEVLTAELLYADADFAALRVLGVHFMLHADHTYDKHPWRRLLKDRLRRHGTGAELRLFGMDPDALDKRARKRHAAVLRKPWDSPHGWREVWVADPDGYVWAVGRASTERALDAGAADVARASTPLKRNSRAPAGPVQLPPRSHSARDISAASKLPSSRGRHLTRADTA